jgi:hypothetical protein
MHNIIRRRLRVRRALGLPTAPTAPIGGIAAIACVAAVSLFGFLTAVAQAATPEASAGGWPQRAATLQPGAAAPKDAASGYAIVGPVSNINWSTGPGASISAAAVVNNSTKPSAALVLAIWATPAANGVPVISPALTFSTLASVSLGTLGAGKEIANINRAGLTYTPPASGCYYVSEALLNGSTLVDLFTLSFGPADTNGTPSPGGYALFSFGGANCAQTSPCENSATTACLLGGRFQVAATYYNSIDGKAQGQVLSFGSTRAQSDESVFFYFTDPGNFELGVKALDACTVNDSFWIFLGGLTNQGWEVNVLDTKTGKFKTYTNALNITTVTTADTTALACP